VSRVYLNGAYIPLEQARVPVLDRGFLFGDGVYEVIPVYGGRPLRPAEHMDRLEASLAAVRIASPLPREAWWGIFRELLGTGNGDRLLYLQVTRGVDARRHHLFPAAASPTVFCMAWDFPPRAASLARDGVAAITLEDLRWLRCDIKSTALLGNVLLRQAAHEADSEEAILVRDGRVTEGSSSNVFLVRGGELVTPPKDHLVLPGITRDLVVELARDAGISCREREVAGAELGAADEVWITSSSREVAPVTRLDGRPVGNGTPGPVWRRLDRLYQEYKMRLPALGAG
jgi:D-alanine transaminase